MWLQLCQIWRNSIKMFPRCCFKMILINRTVEQTIWKRTQLSPLWRLIKGKKKKPTRAVKIIHNNVEIRHLKKTPTIQWSSVKPLELHIPDHVPLMFDLIHFTLHSSFVITEADEKMLRRRLNKDSPGWNCRRDRCSFQFRQLLISVPLAESKPEISMQNAYLRAQLSYWWLILI